MKSDIHTTTPMPVAWPVPDYHQKIESRLHEVVWMLRVFLVFIALITWLLILRAATLLLPGAAG